MFEFLGFGKKKTDDLTKYITKKYTGLLTNSISSEQQRYELYKELDESLKELTPDNSVAFLAHIEIIRKKIIRILQTEIPGVNELIKEIDTFNTFFDSKNFGDNGDQKKNYLKDIMSKLQNNLTVGVDVKLEDTTKRMTLQDMLVKQYELLTKNDKDNAEVIKTLNQCIQLYHSEEIVSTKIYQTIENKQALQSITLWNKEAETKWSLLKTLRSPKLKYIAYALVLVAVIGGMTSNVMAATHMNSGSDIHGSNNILSHLVNGQVITPDGTFYPEFQKAIQDCNAMPLQKGVLELAKLLDSHGVKYSIQSMSSSGTGTQNFSANTSQTYADYLSQKLGHNVGTHDVDQSYDTMLRGNITDHVYTEVTSHNGTSTHVTSENTRGAGLHIAPDGSVFFRIIGTDIYNNSQSTGFVDLQIEK